MRATTRRALSLLAAGLLVSLPRVVPASGPWRVFWETAGPMLGWLAGLYAPAPTRRARARRMSDGSDHR